jgi:hypothetical protein
MRHSHKLYFINNLICSLQINGVNAAYKVFLYITASGREITAPSFGPLSFGKGCPSVSSSGP